MVCFARIEATLSPNAKTQHENSKQQQKKIRELPVRECLETRCHSTQSFLKFQPALMGLGAFSSKNLGGVLYCVFSQF